MIFLQTILCGIFLCASTLKLQDENLEDLVEAVSNLNSRNIPFTAPMTYKGEKFFVECANENGFGFSDVKRKENALIRLNSIVESPFAMDFIAFEFVKKIEPRNNRSVVAGNKVRVLITEFVDSAYGDLEKAVSSQKSLQEIGKSEFLIPFVWELAKQIEFLHRHGIIHHDLHQGNVMIRRDGSPLIVDFGHATLAPENAQNCEYFDNGRKMKFRTDKMTLRQNSQDEDYYYYDDWRAYGVMMTEIFNKVLKIYPLESLKYSINNPVSLNDNPLHSNDKMKCIVITALALVLIFLPCSYLAFRYWMKKGINSSPH